MLQNIHNINLPAFVGVVGAGVVWGMESFIGREYPNIGWLQLMPLGVAAGIGYQDNLDKAGEFAFITAFYEGAMFLVLDNLSLWSANNSNSSPITTEVLGMGIEFGSEN